MACSLLIDVRYSSLEIFLYLYYTSHRLIWIFATWYNYIRKEENLQFIHPKLQNRHENPPKTANHAVKPPSGNCDGWCMDTFVSTFSRSVRNSTSLGGSSFKGGIPERVGEELEGVDSVIIAAAIWYQGWSWGSCGSPNVCLLVVGTALYGTYQFSSYVPLCLSECIKKMKADGKSLYNVSFFFPKKYAVEKKNWLHCRKQLHYKINQIRSNNQAWLFAAD